jgi:hypothetical protein
VFDVRFVVTKSVRPASIGNRRNPGFWFPGPQLMFNYLRLFLAGPLLIVVGLMLLDDNVAAPEDGKPAVQEVFPWRAWVAIGGGAMLSLWGLTAIIRMSRNNQEQP